MGTKIGNYLDGCFFFSSHTGLRVEHLLYGAERMIRNLLKYMAKILLIL